MQTINIPPTSQLAEALITVPLGGNEDVFMWVRTRSGKTVYDGILHHWTISSKHGEKRMEASFMSPEEDRAWLT